MLFSSMVRNRVIISTRFSVLLVSGFFADVFILHFVVIVALPPDPRQVDSRSIIVPQMWSVGIENRRSAAAAVMVGRTVPVLRGGITRPRRPQIARFLCHGHGNDFRQRKFVDGVWRVPLAGVPRPGRRHRGGTEFDSGLRSAWSPIPQPGSPRFLRQKVHPARKEQTSVVFNNIYALTLCFILLAWLFGVARYTCTYKDVGLFRRTYPYRPIVGRWVCPDFVGEQSAKGQPTRPIQPSIGNSVAIHVFSLHELRG